MLYHLSYKDSTQLFSQNLFTSIRLGIYHDLFTNFSESNHRLCPSLEECIRSSGDRAFDQQSKGPGLETQRSQSVPFFTENFFKIYWKSQLVLNDVNSKSQVNRVNMVEFGYHGEWYILLIIDIIDWNDLEKLVSRK